jgi:hypothetical protein
MQAVQEEVTIRAELRASILAFYQDLSQRDEDLRVTIPEVRTRIVEGKFIGDETVGTVGESDESCGCFIGLTLLAAGWEESDIGRAYCTLPGYSFECTLANVERGETSNTSVCLHMLDEVLAELEDSGDRGQW